VTQRMAVESRLRKSQNYAARSQRENSPRRRKINAASRKRMRPFLKPRLEPEVFCSVV